MKFKEKIYDKYRNIISTSTDICEFKYPNFTSVGMGMIGEIITSESDNVLIIDEDIDMNIDITFTNNLNQLTEDVVYTYFIMRYDTTLSKFTTTGSFVSNNFDYVGVNHQNTINTSNLLGEGEYLLKMTFQYDSCTEIANLMGKRQITSTFNESLPYGNYDENTDKYFIVIYKAQEPLLDNGVNDGNVNDGEEAPNTDKLTISPMVVENGVSNYSINIQTSSDVMVSLNGSVLSIDEDYTLSGNQLTFLEPLRADDLVNLIFVGKSNTSGIRTANYSITTPIDQGITGDEGDSNVYFNTESGKYELYTEYRISNGDSFIVMINGAVLSNQIDYFVSATNKKRVILNGEILNGDEIVVIYDSGENLVRAVTTNAIDLNWYVTNNINTTDGKFVIELALDESFIQIEQSIDVPYIINQQTYKQSLDLMYEYGTVLYYRIRNVKNYTTISEDILTTENLSDVIRIEIKTNISNNY